MADSNHDVDVCNDEVQEIDGADNMWTDKLESYFVSLMVDEITNGKMQATTFANAAWQTIAAVLKKKTGKEYTYLQLKNKYHNLRVRWSDFSYLLKEREIRYNSITGEVTATDDVWRKLFPRYRRAKTFRKKGLKDYDKLCMIFGDPKRESIREDRRNKDRVPDGSSEGDGEASEAKRIEELQTPKAQATTIMGDKSIKKQKLEKMSTTASLDSVGNGNDGCGYQRGSGAVHVHDDVVGCMEALNALEGVDGESYVKATKYIHDDHLWRKMFLCMPDERKKDWVLNI